MGLLSLCVHLIFFANNLSPRKSRRIRTGVTAELKLEFSEMSDIVDLLFFFFCYLREPHGRSNSGPSCS